MNQELQKQFVLKLILVSASACAAWFFLVKPVHEQVEAQRQTIMSHTNRIEAYNSRADAQNEADSVMIEQELQSILKAMISTTGEIDPGTMVHTLLNEAAGRSGVSITRIESVNARQISQRILKSTQSVKGIEHTLRVEFEGAYSSVVNFMNDFNSAEFPVAFTSIRMAPTGLENIRVNAELNSVMLTSIPTETASVTQGADDEH